MRVNMAHLREQGIDFTVFEAKARSDLDRDRNELLDQLVQASRSQGLKVDKAALAYRHGGRMVFFGTPDLVKFLGRLGGDPEVVVDGTSNAIVDRGQRSALAPEPAQVKRFQRRQASATGSRSPRATQIGSSSS